MGSVISATFWKNSDHRFSMVVPWDARKNPGVLSIFDFFVVFCNFEDVYGGFEGLHEAHTTFLWFQKAFFSFPCLQNAGCVSLRETAVGEGRRKETFFIFSSFCGFGILVSQKFPSFRTAFLTESCVFKPSPSGSNLEQKCFGVLISKKEENLRRLAHALFFWRFLLSS